MFTAPRQPQMRAPQSLQGAANEWNFIGKFKKKIVAVKTVLLYGDGLQQKSCGGAAKSLKVKVVDLYSASTRSVSNALR